MTINIISIVLFIIFTALGTIHFYWVFGGKWGLEQALPTKINEEKALDPSRIATAVVGVGLISFGLFYLLKSGLISFQVSNWATIYGSWIIPSIFLLRAIGDFKYVGFFKKIKHTEFAKADSKLFVPLCLVIGIFGILIPLMSR